MERISASYASWDLLETIQAFFHAPSYHIIFEAALIIWIFRLLFMKSYAPKERSVLSEKEKEELIADWKPEPLVPETQPDDPALRAFDNVIYGKIGKLVNLNGQECLNMATFNFLGMVGSTTIEEKAVKSLRKYGVGSCGPRGFYGTVDVHLELEESLAKFMGCEEAIIYSYGFSTIASAIPAYSKRGDVIFCDDGVGLAIQKGILASRSKVHYFRHNDMSHLEELLMEQEKEDKKNPKKAKATRRFLIVEGLYPNLGDLCPLTKLVEMKWKYKVRLFMDESFSFGVLGKTGRGVTEYFGVSVDEIDLISASLENSIGSIGGFCCGKAYVVDHQRLSGQGYCFSASLPPMLAAAAIEAVHIMDTNQELYANLQRNAQTLHKQLSSIPGVVIQGESISPIKHLKFEQATNQNKDELKRLQEVVDKARTKGLAITVARYLVEEEIRKPAPSIRLAVTSEFTEEDIMKAVSVIKDSFQTVF